MTPHRGAWHTLDPATAYALMRLRVDVFVVEQQCAYPELDGRDLEPRTEHVWFADDHGPSAYLRVLAEPDGATLRIGRVVTRPDARGAGLSARLVHDVVHRHGGVRPLVLDAQAHLVQWYTRHGFTVAGELYTEDGIPHRPMRRAPSVALTQTGPTTQAGTTTQASDATRAASSTRGPV